jgi:thiol-disulfide isomerase/thioredoxin
MRSANLAAVAFFIFSVSLIGTPSFSQEANTIQSLPIQKVDAILRQPGYCLVVIMAAWCHPCIEELPAVNALYQKYHPEGLRVVGISLDYAGPQAMQPIVTKLKIRFPVYWAGEAAIEPYGISKIPLLLFFREGKIIRRTTGGRDKAALEKEIIAFLGSP